MFKLCHSIQIVTEHKHYYEKEVTLARKRKNRYQETSELLDSQFLQKSHQPQPSLESYESIYSCPEINGRYNKSRGIELISRDTPRPTEIPISYQKQRQDFTQYHHFANGGFLHTTRQAPTLHQKLQYFGATSQSPQKIIGHQPSSTHKPHPLISKKKPSITSFQTTTQIKKQKEMDYHQDFKQIHCSLKNNPRKQDKISMIMANNEHNLQRTKKKEPKYNPRHSQETSFNHYSQIQLSKDAELRQLEIDSDPPTITIHPCARRLNALQESPSLSPRKLKKQLEDAKSIISRDESSSRFQDVKLEESILLKREIDMFEFITPVSEISTCEMAKAIDRRNNALVTLKIFREDQSPYQELQIFRKIEPTREDTSLRILKFQELFMEDTSAEKKIIFVFEPFQRTLGQHITSIKLNPCQSEAFLGRFKEQLLALLEQLIGLELKVVYPLHLDDFVMTCEGWRFHNLSKISRVSSQQVVGDCSQVLGPLWAELTF